MKTLINIDYLIINLSGSLDEHQIFDKNNLNNLENPFSFELSDFGTSIFSVKHNVFYNNERLGVLTSVPRSSIMAKDFIQFQFENSIFYTSTLNELKTLIHSFCDVHKLIFSSINRLDLAIDKQQNYADLHKNILSGQNLISGRSKSVNSYFETFKGKSVLNGFTIGKRSGSRFLRVYNKTQFLINQPKQYIKDLFDKSFEHDSVDVWRFEFQLNAKFFADLKKLNKYLNISESLTFNVFDIDSIIDLLYLAEKNFFEITSNTNKNQTNKETKILIHCWQSIKKAFKTVTSNIIIKVKKPFEVTSVIHKRFAKSLFRAYYLNNQDYLYFNTLYFHLIEENLLDWFVTKLPFYLSEFHSKQKLILFNKLLFHEHQNEFIQSY